ncbi:hypothetical protein [uncultured Draconibacterium sp.]|mgnify:CR=1 FL=1|uniref:hypothetical protein n=1 Tax=uncultured Draconibacterium sp. TaxID=1573823 RepID=UPI0025E36EFC|nr:hypothetical protein [uncultured Draconibacterium sp.]
MRTLVVFFMMFLSTQLMAQSVPELNSLVDKAIFPHPVFIVPNPPKPIKGWNIQELPMGGEKQNILKGSPDGQIIKFRFRGTAVGMLAYTNKNSANIECSVDGQPWMEIELAAETEELQLKGFTLDNGLKNRKHTLQIRIPKASKQLTGHVLLRSFYVNQK